MDLIQANTPLLLLACQEEDCAIPAAVAGPARAELHRVDKTRRDPKGKQSILLRIHPGRSGHPPHATSRTLLHQIANSVGSQKYRLGRRCQTIPVFLNLMEEIRWKAPQQNSNL